MVFFRTLTSNYFYKFLKYLKSPTYTSHVTLRNSPILLKSHSRVYSSSLFSRRLLSSVAQEISFDVPEPQRVETESENAESKNDTTTKKKKKKPLDVYFKEVVGLIKPIEESESSSSSEDSKDIDSKSKEIKELKKRLRDLERKVRSLQGNAQGNAAPPQRRESKTKDNGVGSATTSLLSLFVEPDARGGKKSRASKGKEIFNSLEPVSLKEEILSPKEFSPELVSLVNRLYEDGLLRNANFLREGTFDLDCFSTHYAQDFLKCAAERFGYEHQEIAKWMSGFDLKKVALYGCPSITHKTVFAAKRLRSFFAIQEDLVCQSCKLKFSCKFKNQKVHKVEKLVLADAMRVLTLYALESVPQELEISEELQTSVRKLLKDAVNLSK